MLRCKKVIIVIIQWNKVNLETCNRVGVNCAVRFTYVCYPLRNETGNGTPLTQWPTGEATSNDYTRPSLHSVPVSPRQRSQPDNWLSLLQTLARHWIHDLMAAEPSPRGAALHCLTMRKVNNAPRITISEESFGDMWIQSRLRYCGTKRNYIRRRTRGRTSRSPPYKYTSINTKKKFVAD